MTVENSKSYFSFLTNKISDETKKKFHDELTQAIVKSTVEIIFMTIAGGTIFVYQNYCKDLTKYVIEAKAKSLIRFYRFLGVPPVDLNPISTSTGSRSFLHVDKEEKKILLPRSDLIEKMLISLSKQNTGSIFLVGAPGSGKTTLVKCLSERMCDNSGLHPSLHDVVIKEGKITDFLSSSDDSEGIAQRAAEFQAELIRNDSKVILFIDEFNVADSKYREFLDALKPILAEDKLRIIACTTPDQYKLMKDDAFLRRFTTIFIDPPKEEILESIIKKGIPRYENHHRCSYPEDILQYAIDESYKAPLVNPAALLKIVDTAGAMTYPRDIDQINQKVVITKKEIDLALIHLNWKEDHIGERNPFSKLQKSLENSFLNADPTAKLIWSASQSKSKKNTLPSKETDDAIRSLKRSVEDLRNRLNRTPSYNDSSSPLDSPLNAELIQFASQLNSEKNILPSKETEEAIRILERSAEDLRARVNQLNEIPLHKDPSKPLFPTKRIR